MKVKTVSTLAAAFTTAFLVLQCPPAFAQRNGGAPRSNGTFRAPAAPQRPATAVPPVIFPMTNPIAPMGNPVAPIMPPAFMRYSTSPPTVVIPGQSRGNYGGNVPGHGDGPRGRGWDRVVVPVGGPVYYYPPYYDTGYYPTYGYGLTPPVTIPGQLPGVGYDYLNPPGVNPNTIDPAAVPVTAPLYEPPPQYYPEPRMIVHEPRPNRVIQPPAIGTSRADVIRSVGQPWGSIVARGQETLYFDGLVVVFSPDGLVTQVR